MNTTDRAEKSFALLEQFTGRAVASGNDKLILSAKNQYKRILEQFPEWISSNTERVGKVAESLGEEQPLSNNSTMVTEPSKPEGEVPLYTQSPHATENETQEVKNTISNEAPIEPEYHTEADFNGMTVRTGQKISGITNIYTLVAISGPRGHELFHLETNDNRVGVVLKSLLEYIDSKDELDVFIGKHLRGKTTPPFESKAQPSGIIFSDIPPTSLEQSPILQQPVDPALATPSDIEIPTREEIQAPTEREFTIRSERRELELPAIKEVDLPDKHRFNEETHTARRSDISPSPQQYASEKFAGLANMPRQYVEPEPKIVDAPYKSDTPISPSDVFSSGIENTKETRDDAKNRIIQSSFDIKDGGYPDWEFLRSFDPLVNVELPSTTGGAPTVIHMDAQTFMNPEGYGVHLEAPFSELRSKMKTLAEVHGLVPQNKESIESYLDRLIWASTQ